MKIIRTEPPENSVDEAAENAQGSAVAQPRLTPGRGNGRTLTREQFNMASDMFNVEANPQTSQELRERIRSVLADVARESSMTHSDRPSTPPRRTRLNTTSTELLMNGVWGNVYTGGFEKIDGGQIHESNENPDGWPKTRSLAKEKFGNRPLVRNKKSGNISAVSNYQDTEKGRDAEKYLQIDELVCSSLPHFTPPDPKGRAGHFTDCVEVGKTNLIKRQGHPGPAESDTEYTVLARTHQNDKAGSVVTFDRLFAVSPSGTVHNVKRTPLPNARLGTNETFPRRGEAFSVDPAKSVFSKFRYYVADEDEKTPNISPDSKKRQPATHETQTWNRNASRLAKELFPPTATRKKKR